VFHSNPLHNELPGILLEPLHLCYFEFFALPKFMVFTAFLRGLNIAAGVVCMGLAQYLSVHRVQHILDGVGHMGMSIVVQNDVIMMTIRRSWRVS
jgi:hypothetical protein